MKRFIQTWTGRLALGLALVLGLGSVVSAHPAPQATDPAAVVNAFSAAWQNPEVQITLVTDDVTLMIVPPPPGTSGVWSGKDQARGFFAFSKSQKVHVELVGSWQVSGNTVSGTVLVTANDFVMLNVGAVQHVYEFVVQDGQIKSWTGTMTPSEQARVGAAAQAFAAAHPAPAPTCADPLTVVHAWEAVNEAGDADAALALFTDDGVITLQPPPPGSSGVFRGKAQIREFLNTFGAGKIHSTATYEVAGDTVTGTGFVSLPSLAQIGIPSVAFTAVYVVRDCKLASFSPTNHFTPAQEALLRAAGPPPGMPATGAPVVLLPLLLAVGLLLLMAGAALRRRKA